MDTDFDAELTGVEVDTGAFSDTYDAVTGANGKAYDAVPQEQGNKIEVYGLGQQDPTEALTGKPSAEPTDLRRSTRVAKYVLQDVERDYGDTLSSSKMRCTHLDT